MTESDKLLANAKRLINKNKLDEAQSVLDTVIGRDGRWHFIQSKLFFRRNWLNECRKHLESAIELEPDNEEYRKVYDKVISYGQSGEAFTNPYSRRQMGNSDLKGVCAEVCIEGGGVCCCEAILQGICDGL